MPAMLNVCKTGIFLENVMEILSIVIVEIIVLRILIGGI
jgi:hypothetical protein